MGWRNRYRARAIFTSKRVKENPSAPLCPPLSLPQMKWHLAFLPRRLHRVVVFMVTFYSQQPGSIGRMGYKKRTHITALGWVCVCECHFYKLCAYFVNEHTSPFYLFRFDFLLAPFCCRCFYLFICCCCFIHRKIAWNKYGCTSIW